VHLDQREIGLCLDGLDGLVPDPVAERHDPDHGSNTDGNPEHGQGHAEALGQELPGGHL
jgi:hypothetical protein